ncbi:MAG: hypothetical protein R3204_15065, partial [Oceanospirillum sp.]|nr:hypothetical protein [Oceanospirillum sp.]
MTDTLPNGAELNPQNMPDLSATPDSETAIQRMLNSKTVPVIFSGKKMEYFKLWLVNLLLSII